MIRLIQRRLIIPRGDTGSFSIPALDTVEDGDIAVFSIYDTLTHKTVFEKRIAATDSTLTIPFEHEDTVHLQPKKYLWDIKIYKNPVYEDENDETSPLIGGEKIDSYYAAFSLPICEIKEVAQDV
jgi:hypothetical protein